MEVGLSPGDFVLDGDPAPSPKRGDAPPIFCPHLLWPNGCMGQDATWYALPARHCVRWGPSSPFINGQSPNFRPMSVVAKRLDGLNASWYGGRPRPRRLCIRWGPSYPQKKGHTHPTQFLAHVYCGQRAEWMKTPLGTEVDLGPGHIVLDGLPALRERGTEPPPHLFGLCLL